MAYYWSTNEYQLNEPVVEPLHRRHHHHHQKKGHVAYRTKYEEPMAEEVEEAYSKPVAETTLQRYQRARHGDHNAFASVDEEADAFLQIEHKRMQLSKTMRDA